jgi:hypothetical protein
MAYSHQEAAVIVAKEIMLGLIAREERSLLLKGPDNQSLRGIELAAHIGDCYEALLKKVMHAVKEV